MATVLVRGEKTRAIREFLTKNPAAENPHVVEALAAQGFEVLPQSVSNVRFLMLDKNGKSEPAKKVKKKRGRKKTAGSESSGKRGAKADAIRQTFLKLGLGKSTRNVDVMNALSAEGITVSPAQVASVRGKMPKRAPKMESAGTAAPAVAADSIQLEHLIAAKSLVEKLGGVEAAKRAVNALAKLQP